MSPAARPARTRRAALAAGLLLALLAGCATVLAPSLKEALDARHGPAEPTRHDVPARPAASAGSVSYARQIQPLLDQRCTVCHACYDAPCQLKTTSWEGLARGASATAVYDATRLLAAPPSRLFEDAQRASEWRSRGFHPVLNERAPTPEANRDAGLMHRLLMLKQQQPWPPADAAAALDFSADRTLQCPSIETLDAYEQAQPHAGMPFGLPPLAPQELSLLTRWLAQGAPAEPPAPLPAALAREVARWEQFFNGDDLKTQLFARYAYEHLFLAHLHFGGPAPHHFFRLVRSATPPGQPVQRIATARPVDDPGVARVYYRLVPERESIVAKTHMPYRLDAQRLARWQALFFTPAYRVSRLPGYTAETAANPFATFAELPLGARYRFLLDEAEFTVMGFIKGPVCRGQIALNVIRDHFWVSFIEPSAEYDASLNQLLARHAEDASLPTGRSQSDVLLAWLAYGRAEQAYQQARTEQMARWLKTPERLGLGLIWDGDGHNPNAALTIFRHFNSASVVQGHVGEPPPNAWVIGYPLLERIHYLLVANYDVYGNLGHQLNSRLYMDYLRAEGEFNFLIFLPQAQRLAVRDQWYRGVGEQARAQVYGGPATTLAVDSGIAFRSADPARELMARIQARLAPVMNGRHDWRQHTPAALHPALQTLAGLKGEALQWLPEASLLELTGPDGSRRTYSLLRNTAHASVSHLLGESLELLPQEYTLTLAAGVIGSYPNAFYRARAAELPALASAIASLRSEADYAAFSRRWAVRRDDPGFWAFSDALLQREAQAAPLTHGVLDYSRMEFR